MSVEYCTCNEPEPEVDVTMTSMYCEKCCKDIKPTRTEESK